MSAGDLLEQIRAEFKARCPDIPCAQARVAEVLGPTRLEPEAVSLQMISDLAYEIGLIPQLTFTKKE